MSITIILLIIMVYGILCVLEGKIPMIFRKILDFFCPKEEDLTGELYVTGKDCLSVKLKASPKEVIVFFKDECVEVPCNPGQCDSVEWVLQKDHEHGEHHHHHYKLNITWDVSSARSVCWAVRY